MVQFLDQSASALSLNLIEGRIDESKFDILAKGFIEDLDIRLDAHIIGGSHFLIIHVGDRCVSEVFACTEIETDLPRLYCGPLGGITKNVECVISGNFRYVFEAGIHDFGPISVCDMEDDFESRYPKHVFLTFEFPKANRTEVYNPTTIVLAGMNSTLIDVSTIHSYPTENKIVTTRSKLQLIKTSL